MANTTSRGKQRADKAKLTPQTLVLDSNFRGTLKSVPLLGRLDHKISKPSPLVRMCAGTRGQEAMTPHVPAVADKLQAGPEGALAHVSGEHRRRRDVVPRCWARARSPQRLPVGTTTPLPKKCIPHTKTVTKTGTQTGKQEMHRPSTKKMYPLTKKMYHPYQNSTKKMYSNQNWLTKKMYLVKHAVFYRWFSPYTFFW